MTLPIRDADRHENANNVTDLDETDLNRLNLMYTYALVKLGTDLIKYNVSAIWTDMYFDIISPVLDVTISYHRDIHRRDTQTSICFFKYKSGNIYCSQPGRGTKIVEGDNFIAKELWWLL